MTWAAFAVFFSAWLVFAWFMTQFCLGWEAHDERAIKELRQRNAGRDATAEKAREVPARDGSSAGFETRGTVR
jgi:hypothetical protein